MDSISCKLAIYLYEAKAIDKNQIDAFSYCINGILEFSAITAAILVTAIISNTLLVSLTIVAVVVSLRTFCGGAHMSNALSCFFVSYSTYILILLIGSLMSNHFCDGLNILTWFFLILINIIGPVYNNVDNSHNKISKSRKHLIFNSFLIFCGTVFFCYRQDYIYCSIIFITVLTVLLLQVIQLFKQKGNSSWKL